MFFLFGQYPLVPLPGLPLPQPFDLFSPSKADSAPPGASTALRPRRSKEIHKPGNDLGSDLPQSNYVLCLSDLVTPYSALNITILTLSIACIHQVLFPFLFG